MSSKSVSGLDVASTVGIIVAAVATIITAALARQMYVDISEYKDDDKYTGDDVNPKRTRAEHEDKGLHAIYAFAVLFLIVYVAYVGYREGMHQGGGGASAKSAKSLKDYGTAMVVLAYVMIVILMLTGGMGIDMYLSGSKFGDVTADFPDGDKKKQAQGLYGTYIAMIVIAVLAFILLTAYLADAKKYAVKFYESWSPSGASSLPASGGLPAMEYEYSLPEDTYGSSFVV